MSMYSFHLIISFHQSDYFVLNTHHDVNVSNTRAAAPPNGRRRAAVKP